MNLTYELIALLFFAGMLAAFVDSIAGGGGLIAIPALLIAGLPPLEAVATNKMQATVGVANTTLAFHKKGLINWRLIRFPLICSLIAGGLGAITLNYIDSSVLKILMPVVLIVVALYFLFAPQPKPVLNPVSTFVFGVCFIAPIAFYDGFFGPGAGSFYLLALVALYGLEIVKANAHNKAFNSASNLASLTVYLFMGKVVFVVAGVMIVGQLIGSYLGAKVALNHGSKIIRPFVVIICLIMAIKMLFF